MQGKFAAGAAASTAPFQDPYSDVSLFLSKKIQEQAQVLRPTHEWSHYLKDRLIKKITPEFEKKFPQFHLSSEAIKKTWEKVSHLSLLFQSQNDALTTKGELNLYFLIRENLKTEGVHHPFLHAQQLAAKIGQSLAMYEGKKPRIEHLTQLIYSALHHLIPFENQDSFFHKTPDMKDRLIMKWIVDILTYQPFLSQQHLHHALQNKLKIFKSFRSNTTSFVQQLYAHWAIKLLPYTQIISSLREWIQKRIDFSLNNVKEQIQDLKTEVLEKWKEISLHDVEIVAWASLIPSTSFCDPFLIELEEEAKLILIHHPSLHWKQAIDQASHFLNKTHALVFGGSLSEWEDRMERGSVLGELILRDIEFPPSPLLHLVQEFIARKKSLLDPFMTSQLREQFLSRYSLPLIEPSRVHQVAELIRKYGWYRLCPREGGQTSLKLFIEFNKTQHLPSLILKKFPLFPPYLTTPY